MSDPTERVKCPACGALMIFPVGHYKGCSIGKLEDRIAALEALRPAPFHHPPIEPERLEPPCS